MVKSNKRRKISKKYIKKGGFKTVLPMEYFNPVHNTQYRTVSLVNPMNNPVSYGQINKNHTQTGPNLFYTKPYVQLGGGALPAEYFGNNSGRYFEEGSPELNTCTHAYGRNINTSHGVVMDPPHNMWLGPNLATFPEFKDMTGGNRRKTKKTKKNRKKISKNRKKISKNRKKISKNRKNNSKNRNSKKNKNRISNKNF